MLVLMLFLITVPVRIKAFNVSNAVPNVTAVHLSVLAVVQVAIQKLKDQDI